MLRVRDAKAPCSRLLTSKGGTSKAKTKSDKKGRGAVNELTTDAVVLGDNALSSSSVAACSGAASLQGGHVQMITTKPRELDSELGCGYIFALIEALTGSEAENEEKIIMLTDD